MPFPRIAIAATIGWLTMAAAGAATAQSPAETVEGNDNRRPAGILGMVRSPSGSMPRAGIGVPSGTRDRH